MDFNLVDRTVIVTGGGSNIGRSIALAFSKEGTNVVIADIDKEQGARVADEAAECGGKAVVIETDVTNFDSVMAMVNHTQEAFGPIDILVNNVGWGMPKLFHKKPRAEWEKEIELDLYSTLNCTKAVIDHMVERRSGKIINISSDAGRMGGFAISIYATCKGGVIAFTKALARELGPYNINVNVICPGLIIPDRQEHTGKLSMWLNEMTRVFTPERLETEVSEIPLRRLGKPEDIACMCVYLASDVSSFITGQTISIDGGWTMM
jgi:2-hydroxycyclohexanecarboxyl-CoA dehydrogenase